MCYFTPTEWRCGHLSYAKIPCRHLETFKDKGLSCPYNTTLGTLWRNKSCGESVIRHVWKLYKTTIKYGVA